MPNYKYRPEITREALQWDPASPYPMRKFTAAIGPLDVDSITQNLYIHTPTGQIAAKPGDYIIKDFENATNLHACAKEHFEKIFQPCCSNHENHEKPEDSSINPTTDK